MNKLDEIREKLIFEIENSGMTKTEICRLIGISTAAMAQYKSGRAMPALDTFAEICKVINADANEILGIK